MPRVDAIDPCWPSDFRMMAAEPSDEDKALLIAEGDKQGYDRGYDTGWDEGYAQAMQDMERMVTDGDRRTGTELLDGLEDMTHKGCAPCICNDDNGHWAVPFVGVQDAGAGMPETIGVRIESQAWQPSLREAIEFAMEGYGD